MTKSASILGTDNCSSTTSAIRGTTTWTTSYYDDSATNASTRFVLSIILFYINMFVNGILNYNHINVYRLFFFIEVMAVPMTMQQGYTAPVLTPAGAPPMYTTIPAAPVAAQMAPAQARSMPNPTVQQPGDPAKGTIG